MRNLRFRLDGKETHAVLITQDDYQCMKDEIKQEIMSELRKSAGKSARAEPNTSSVQKEIHILLQQEKFLKLTNVLLKNYRELKKYVWHRLMKNRNVYRTTTRVLNGLRN